MKTSTRTAVLLALCAAGGIAGAAPQWPGGSCMLMGQEILELARL